MMFKKEYFNEIEYHYPATFKHLDDYLLSLTDTVITSETMHAMVWDSVRLKRDSLISATDWTQMPDAPLTPEKKAEFTAYRQALRDLPQTYDNPDDIVWPTKPTI